MTKRQPRDRAGRWSHTQRHTAPTEPLRRTPTPIPTDRADELRIVFARARRVVTDGWHAFIATGSSGDDLRELAQFQIQRLAEICSRIPPEIRAEYPDVPWRDIQDMRNRIIHVYNHVDDAIVWSALSDELPEIEAALAAHTYDDRFATPDPPPQK